MNVEDESELYTKLDINPIIELLDPNGVECTLERTTISTLYDIWESDVTVSEETVFEYNIEMNDLNIISIEGV